MVYRNFRPSGLMVLAVVTMLLPIHQSVAQQLPQPAAVISIASVDDQLADIEYLGAATSQIAGILSKSLRPNAEANLPGVDFDKAAGAILYFVEGEDKPNMIGFVPVNNLDDLLDELSDQADIEEEDGLYTVLTETGQEFVVKAKDGYAFVTDTAELLNNLPANPAKLVAAQSAKYNVSAQLYPQRIPEELRQQALDFIREGVESSVDELDEDDLQGALQKAQADMQLKQMEMMVNEFEQVTLGLNIDKEAGRVYLDVNMKGLENSDMAKRLVATKTSEPSKFAGFLMEGAAMTMHNCSGISADDAKLYVESFDNIRDVLLDEIVEEEDEAKAAVLTKLTTRLSEVLKKTLEGGVMDMGGTIFVEDGLNAAFGAKIADTSGLEKSIKEIVAEAKPNLDDNLVFELDAGKIGNYNLHKIMINLPVDDLDEFVVEMVGETVTVMLAIGESEIYTAVGKDPEALLKKSIDANASAPQNMELVGQYNFFIAPIMEMLASNQDDQMMQALGGIMEGSEKDQVRMTYNVVDGEFQYRMEMEEGVFKVLGVVGQFLMGGGGGGLDF